MPNARLIFYPIFAGFASVWTLGALAETYLTYKEKMPAKGEDRTSPWFWIAAVVIGLFSICMAWGVLVLTSLTSLFLRYGTTTTKWELPKQTFTQSQQATAQKNLTSISSLFAQESPATKLTLSQDDINAMIATVS